MGWRYPASARDYRRLAQARLAPHRHTVVQAQHHRLAGRAAQAVEELGDRLPEQRRKRVRPQAVDRLPELELGAAVGREKTPVLAEHHDAFHQGAQKFGPCMKVKANGLRIGIMIAKFAVGPW